MPVPLDSEQTPATGNLQIRYLQENVYDQHKRRKLGILVEGGAKNTTDGDMKGDGDTESRAAEVLESSDLKRSNPEEASTKLGSVEMICDVSEFRRRQELHASCK